MSRRIGLLAFACAFAWSLQATAAAPKDPSKAPSSPPNQSDSKAPRALSKSPAGSRAASSKAPRRLETHTVHLGQRLGSIAKRYNVSIEALCNANGISRKDPIRPGQKLVVPARSDKDGSLARQIVLAEADAANADAKPDSSESSKPSTENKDKPDDKVAAKSNAALSSNGKDQKDTKAGEGDHYFPKVAPARAALPPIGTLAKGRNGKRQPSWATYTKPAQKRGYVVLNATGRSWKGYAIVKGNRLSNAAQTGFNHALYSWRTGNERQIAPGLIRLLAQVSDAFGGRPLRVVSGYREHSHFKESRHLVGNACDFSIPGVPNEVLRDYLLTFDDVGVGYYPNSSFVHLDVRKVKATWIDFAGPGERPRSHRERALPPAVVQPVPRAEVEFPNIAKAPTTRPTVTGAAEPTFVARTAEGGATALFASTLVDPQFLSGHAASGRAATLSNADSSTAKNRESGQLELDHEHEASDDDAEEAAVGDNDGKSSPATAAPGSD
ncbi:MAG TPA: DUF882 domain-containing protein [Polyangiaceae bacterium]|nr:DUF882 domain-containing protein [Polyangiaceae bacterium]